MKKLIISAAIAASSIAIVPEVAQAQNIRFQIIMGDENAVRRLCRQHRYSPYNIVNGRFGVRRSQNPNLMQRCVRLNTAK